MNGTSLGDELLFSLALAIRVFNPTAGRTPFSSQMIVRGYLESTMNGTNQPNFRFAAGICDFVVVIDRAMLRSRLSNEGLFGA